MLGILPNLPHLLRPSSEPSSSVPYLFWTLQMLYLDVIKYVLMVLSLHIRAPVVIFSAYEVYPAGLCRTLG